MNTNGLKQYTRDELNSMRCLSCDAAMYSVTHNTPVDTSIWYEAEFSCGCQIKTFSLDPYLPKDEKEPVSLGSKRNQNNPHSLSDEVKGLSLYPEHATGIVDEPDATRGKKFDDNKSRFHLMPRQAEQEVVDVLTYGAIKYDEYNWQKVEPLNDRYYSAARRHMQAFMNGERRDIESGLHHLAHAACCLLFMLENDLQHELPESVKHQAS